MSLVTVFLGLVVPVANLSSANDSDDPWTVVTKAGKALYAQAGWALSTSIAVLLAFFAVAIGGQIFGNQREAERLRRILGVTAELVAAGAVPLLMYVACYCISSRDQWAGLIAIVPAYGLILFLSLHLGQFVVFANEEKLSAIEVTLASRARRLTALNARSRRAFWPAIVTATAAPAVIAVVAVSLTSWRLAGLSPLNVLGRFPLMLLGAILTACVISAVNGAAMRSFYIDLSGSRWFYLIFPVLLCLFGVLPLVLSLHFSGHTDYSWSVLVVGAIFLITMLLPRRRQPKWLRDWTLTGITAASARRRLGTQQESDRLERTRLLKAILPEPRESLVDRVRAIVQRARQAQADA